MRGSICSAEGVRPSRTVSFKEMPEERPAADTPMELTAWLSEPGPSKGTFGGAEEFDDLARRATAATDTTPTPTCLALVPRGGANSRRATADIGALVRNQAANDRREWGSVVNTWLWGSAGNLGIPKPTGYIDNIPVAKAWPVVQTQSWSAGQSQSWSAGQSSSFTSASSSFTLAQRASFRDRARTSVCRQASKLLPKVEALKNDAADDGEGSETDAGWSGQVNRIVKSGLHAAGSSAIGLACRSAGVDPASLKELDVDGLPVVPADTFVSNRSIREALTTGDTVLVKGSWLQKRCAGAGGILPRRQELHDRFPNAIWKVDELMDLVQSGNVCIIAVSYCWYTKEHPDPKGEQMQALCRVLRQFMESTPLEDVALFIDWCSMHQQPRSAEEDTCYARALNDWHLWYAHQGTRVWMMTQVPADAELVTPYNERGWQILERALSKLVTKGHFLLDLSKLGEQEIKIDVTAFTWVQLAATCKPGRDPPALPQAFASTMHDKMFIDGPLGRDFVIQKYWDAFREVIASAEELSFNELGWEDAEARQLALILPRCHRLRKLNLYGNRIDSGGAIALGEVFRSCRTLEELWLTNNPVARKTDMKTQLGYAWAEAGHNTEQLHL